MGWSKIGAIVVSTEFGGTTHASPRAVSLSGLTLAVGDLLVVSHTWGTVNITASMALTDNASVPNTYSKHPSPLWSAGNGQGTGKFYSAIQNITSLTQLSFSWTGGGSIDFIGWVIEQFRHSAGALPSGNPATTTTPASTGATSSPGTDGVSSGNTTPAVAGSLVHGNVMFEGGFSGTLTQGTGFTLGTNDTATTLQATEWLEDAGTSALPATFTITATLDTQTLVAAFAPPSGGGGTVVSRAVTSSSASRVGSRAGEF